MIVSQVSTVANVAYDWNIAFVVCGIIHAFAKIFLRFKKRTL